VTNVIESNRSTSPQRRWLVSWLALVAALLAAPAAVSAQSAGQIEYETYELDNGLRVILAEDRSVPVAAVNVWYHVGSRHDPRDRSGFAHLFEHMMFEGTKHVGKTEETTHMSLIQNVGGSLNGTTAADRTNYFETVPANRVNLALWLEADRMRFLNVTEENFENQRSVVKEERRQGLENAPYAKAIRSAIVQPYDSTTCFPYSRMGIGSMEDLNAASIEDVRAFYRAHYAPNNAVLTVVGDFDAAQVRKLIQQYFGGAEPAEIPPEEECEVSYSPGMQVDSVMDPNANLPAVVWTFRTPPHDHADTYALTLLSTILGEGQSSRLHRSMVSDAGAAAQVVTLYQQVGWRKGPGVMLSYAIANQGVSPDSLRSVFWDEVERLRESPPTGEELEKAKNSYVADLVMGRQTAMQKAEALQHFALYHDDLADVNRVRERFLEVTREDLDRVIDRYLTRENLSVMVDIPSAGGEAATDDAAAGSPAADERRNQ